MYEEIFKTIINKPDENLFTTGTVVTVNPLTIELLPGDTPIPCIAISSLIGAAVGSRLILLRYGKQFVALGVVWDAFAGGWTNWTPGLTWTGTPPGNLTVNARYIILGKTCHIAIYLESTDGNGATNLMISLPTNALTADTDITYVLSAYQKVNTTWTPILAYTNVWQDIQFLNFVACTDGVACGLRITGFYEIV